jgi:hypothetical protein
LKKNSAVSSAIKIKDNVVVAISLIADAPRPDSAPSGPPTLQTLASIKQERDQAIRRVQEIVNQPVSPVQRTDQMGVSVCDPDWFHPGAIKPDFNRVDVRATRKCDYDKCEYVCSKAHPEAVYLGRELEFNPMTKYFYTDRSVPKKKLTESEMVEINRLYRIIGRCEHQLEQLQPR